MFEIIIICASVEFYICVALLFCQSNSGTNCTSRIIVFRQIRMINVYKLVSQFSSNFR